jgi:hypothetical protein
MLMRAEGALDTLQITAKFYGKGDVPFNGPNIIGGTLRRLAAKVNYNHEDFTVVRTGKRPISWAIKHNAKVTSTASRRMRVRPARVPADTTGRTRRSVASLPG